MCTVSIIPLSGGGGYRLVTNRDEHRERAEAVPPRWHDLTGTRAIWPTDAAAGGTWVAAAAHGLTLTLLNLNLRSERGAAPARFGGVSRGLVIPRLVGSATAEDAAEALTGMNLGEFLPFRLIAVRTGGLMGEGAIVECRWDGASVGVIRHDGSPICFVSSGLGDRLVEPRLALFESLVVARGATPEAQDEFHRHLWPERAAISVMMTRADARTVSVCRVEARPGRSAEGAWKVGMEYVPVPETPVVKVTGRAGVVR